MRALILLSLLALCQQATAVGATTQSAIIKSKAHCPSEVERLAAGAELDGDSRKAKAEIASLMVEKSLLTGPGQSSLRALLEKNLRLKISEYENYFGQALKPEEIRKMILEKENERQASDKTNKFRETRVRTREKEMNLDWTLSPVFVARDFALHSTALPNGNVAAFKSNDDHFKILYSTPSSAPNPGFHIFDVTTRTDVAFEGKLERPAYFASAKEEAVLSSPWLNNGEPSSIDVYDSSTGRLKKSYPFAKAISDIALRHFQGQPRLYPFEKANGEMGLVFTFRVGARTSLDVFNLDMVTGIATELVSLDADSIIYQSRDNKHVYAYGVSSYQPGPTANFEKTLNVTDVLTGKNLLSSAVFFNTIPDASVFVANQVAFYESALGNLYVGLYRGSNSGADQLHFFDVFAKKEKVLAGEPDSMGGGRLVEDQGKLYFMHSVRPDGRQAIINVQNGVITVKDMGKYTALGPIGTISTEQHGTFLLYESIVANGGGPNIEVLPLSDQLSNYQLNLSGKTATKLHATFKNQRGQVFGVFTSQRAVANDNLYNLHLIQLYGPPAEHR